MVTLNGHSKVMLLLQRCTSWKITTTPYTLFTLRMTSVYYREHCYPVQTKKHTGSYMLMLLQLIL